MLFSALNSLTSATSRATRANLRRYQQMTRMYRQRHSVAMGELANVGQQQTADINQRFTNLGGRMQQDLVSRGLSASTLGGDAMRGVETDRSSALARLGESLAMQRVNVGGQLSGDLLAMMERRTDSYPDVSSLLQMLQALGRVGVRR